MGIAIGISPAIPFQKRTIATTTLAPTTTIATTTEYPYADESLSLFARMLALGEDPDDARKLVIDDAIVALISAGIWAKLDVLWVLASHASGSAYLNWIEDAHNCTLTGAGILTTDRGWAGNGTTGHLDTHYNPSTEGVNLIQDSASVFFYSRTNSVGNMYDMDAETDTDHLIISFTKYTDNNCYGAVNGVVAAGAITRSDGLILLTRSDSAHIDYWRNKAEHVYTSGVNNSTGLPNTNIHIGCQNATGVFGGFSTREVAFAGAGGNLLETDKDNLYDIMVDGYLTTIGANV